MIVHGAYREPRRHGDRAADGGDITNLRASVIGDSLEEGLIRLRARCLQDVAKCTALGTAINLMANLKNKISLHRKPQPP